MRPRTARQQQARLGRRHLKLRGLLRRGGDGIDLLVATKNEVPQLASMLCEPLHFADGAAAGAFLEKVATGSAGELTYEELELCDGLYFRESMKKGLCLGLTAWGAKERARRQATTDAEVEAHKERRAALSGLSVEEKDELANMPPKPIAPIPSVNHTCLRASADSSRRGLA